MRGRNVRASDWGWVLVELLVMVMISVLPLFLAA
jgi:hypothetical protein